MHKQDRPTMQERYARATNTSHLEVEERRRGDVDLLIAAGWSREWLGTRLYRLAAEYDEARGDHAIARRNMMLAMQRAEDHEKAAARSLRASAAPSGSAYEHWTDAMLALNDAARARAEVDHEATMARAFILLKLKSLAATKEEVGFWAMTRAARCRFMSPGPCPLEAGPARPERMKAWRAAVVARNEVVMHLAGRVLDVFLDDLCIRCQGRGFNGGAGSRPILCRGCSGSGRRRTALGRSQAEQAFAFMLLAGLERMLDRVQFKMTRFLSARECV